MKLPPREYIDNDGEEIMHVPVNVKLWGIFFTVVINAVWVGWLFGGISTQLTDVNRRLIRLEDAQDAHRYRNSAITNNTKSQESIFRMPEVWADRR